MRKWTLAALLTCCLTLSAQQRSLYQQTQYKGQEIGKLTGDVYYARVYRMAAARLGVSEYRNLVDEKLRTMGELYDFMVDRFNESRSFVLELAVAVMALLDVILFAILLAKGG